MHVIVPLAGPDFVDSNGQIKALLPYKDQPILRYTLHSRPWAYIAKTYTFILLDTPKTRLFAEDFLSPWFNNSRFVFISNVSQGAACSTLAGLSILNDFNSPIVVDLADIIYEFKNYPAPSLTFSDSFIGAYALTFLSKNPSYSYLKYDANGNFLYSREKSVVSTIASAGTYVFKNMATFLRAMAYAYDYPDLHTYNNLFYVCPLFNGVHSQQLSVNHCHVDLIYDPKNSH